MLRLKGLNKHACARSTCSFIRVPSALIDGLQYASQLPIAMGRGMLLILLANIISAKLMPGFRRDAQGEATHVFTKLSDDDDDPYLSTAEYLLNWAVHTGAVEASSMAELRRTISAPSFSHIEWTHPNRPVLCASDQDGELQYDSPAHAHHIESYVRAITKSVPALHDMKCSALRWGSIYEAWEMGRVDAALAMLDECREVDSSAS